MFKKCDSYLNSVIEGMSGMQNENNEYIYINIKASVGRENTT